MSTTLTLEHQNGNHVRPDKEEIDLRLEEDNVTVTLTMTQSVADVYRFMRADESGRFGVIFANAGGFSSDVFDKWTTDAAADPPKVQFVATNTDKKSWTFWITIVNKADSTVLLIDPSIRDK